MNEHKELEIIEEYLEELEANLEELEGRVNMAAYLAVLANVLEEYSE